MDVAQVFGVLDQTLELKAFSGPAFEFEYVYERLQVRSIRSFWVGQVDPEENMSRIGTVVKNVNVQHMSMDIYDLHLHDCPDPDELGSIAPAFLNELEQNTHITSSCPTRKCSPFVHREGHCAFGCPEETVSRGNHWLPGVETEYFDRSFEKWYYAARIVAIGRRNAELERRVHAAVFRLLPFLRMILHVNGTSPRLPVEVLEHIGSFLGSDVLCKSQMARLRELATSREESRRVARVLREVGLRRSGCSTGSSGGSRDMKRPRRSWGTTTLRGLRLMIWRLCCDSSLSSLSPGRGRTAMASL